jgi:hypothetical protein
MGELGSKPDPAIGNVTLDPLGAAFPEFLGKEFPCPVCGAGLPILITKRKKPYCTCNSCGIQIFVRGKVGISRLRKLVRDGILISSSGEGASHGIALLNRLEQLELQKQELILKHPLIFLDSNVQNAIVLIDAEIESVQGELAKIASSKRKEPHK